MNCKHYFGRTVKSMEGIPYDYERGCMANHDLDKCGDECPFCEPKGYKPTTMGTPFEDLTRYMENIRKQGINPREVRMPADYYAKLTPDQIEWAENEYHCKLTPVKPIVFHSTATFRTSKGDGIKTSSPKEYGMSLMKRKRRY